MSQGMKPHMLVYQEVRAKFGPPSQEKDGYMRRRRTA